MRNLTFGVILVSGGILAAVPFRRDGHSGDALQPGALADSPSTDELKISPLVFDTEPVQAVSNPYEIASHVMDPGMIPSQAVVSGRRDLSVPLTYEDLAVPLATPGYVAERFGAVQAPPVLPTTALAGQIASRRVENASEPPQSAYSAGGRTGEQGLIDRRDLVDSTVKAPTVQSSMPAAVTGKLAGVTSGTIPARSDNSQSPSDAAPRARYWIRQPD